MHLTDEHRRTYKRMEIIKFRPILKQVLWGGDKIIPFKQLNIEMDQVGESWEISGDEKQRKHCSQRAIRRYEAKRFSSFVER